ncbi:hypothetical protein GGI12_000700 [Dipsacomyces acuminosporus]|nr:hypothetical protein GGI12_000700 [Dipsacomyces acuminosporus]
MQRAGLILFPSELSACRSSVPFSGLTRQEILHGAANRLLYSQFYTFYYIGMLALGLVSLVTAFVEKCPSLFFIILESVMCICMILEIVTRGIAVGKSFLTSWWNYFDIVIVLLCGITLILLTRGCSASSNSEELFNTIMLVIRNGAQISRLLATLRKNRRQLDARGMNVDLDSNSDFLGMINDMDGLVGVSEDGYHIPGAPGADISRLLATLRKNRRQLDARGMNVDLDSNSDFLGMINDMDGLVGVSEDGYHIPGAPGADVAGEFRLSIDTFDDGGYPQSNGFGHNSQHQSPHHISGVNRTPSVSSTSSSVHSNPERLAGRRKNFGGGGQ